ncbi:MAG: uL15m family ribosomal protein [Candidatus Micrarchaeia archaeon]
MKRKEKRSRKYLGSRTWGAGNTKNRRGKGCRGGKGMAGSFKHRYTLITAIGKEKIKKLKKGFVSKKEKLKEINLFEIEKIVNKTNKNELFLRGYKVLGEGVLKKPITIYASAFSKGALEKIEKAGGKAVIKTEE